MRRGTRIIADMPSRNNHGLGGAGPAILTEVHSMNIPAIILLLLPTRQMGVTSTYELQKYGICKSNYTNPGRKLSHRSIRLRPNYARYAQGLGHSTCTQSSRQPDNSCTITARRQDVSL